MKKALATTMATLLFGLSFPANTFALPNNVGGLESTIVEDINLDDYKNMIFDKDSKSIAGQENQQGQEDKVNPIPEGHRPGIINSDQAENGRPEGYVTVTFTVDTRKAKFENESEGKSEIKFYVYKTIGVKLNEIGKNIKVLSLDSAKYEIDQASPWIIKPEKFSKDSAVTEDISLTANIKAINNQASEEEFDKASKQEKTIAERITKNALYAADISLWMGDTINWKEGVGLDTSVTDPELKKAFDEAKFEGDGRNSNNPRTSGVEGKIKVIFTDNSFIEVEGQKLFVFPHVTGATYDNAPEDAIKTTLFLGEGTKVIDGNVIREGNAEHPSVFKTYKVKPGADLSKYILPTNKSVIENINLQPLNDSYINPHWEPDAFVVSEMNNKFTAKASKRYKITFEFQGLDLDTKKDIDAGLLAKVLKDKLPEEAWVEKGKTYKPTRPNNFTEILKDDGRQVTRVYDWTFAGWNPIGIPSASEDKKLVGTWKRAQARSAEPRVEKITESDKIIKGQGQVGAKIKITFGDKTSLETTVGEDSNWEVKITKDLKKNDKVSVTQIELGKKESQVKEFSVSEKKKENKKPDTNPTPGTNPDNKPLPNPDKKENSKDKNKENQRKNNYFASNYKNHTSKTTRVKTQVENKKQNNIKKEEARYIIDVMSGNYQVIMGRVGQNKKMDVMPVIKNDRLMLPLRNIAEIIGAKVEWDPQTRTASFTNKDLLAKIQIDGNEIVLSNGKVIKMDSKPLNINGRILLSVSNVANVFGLTNGNTKDGIDQNIEWDGDNKTVEINLKK